MAKRMFGVMDEIELGWYQMRFWGGKFDLSVGWLVGFVDGCGGCRGLVRYVRLVGVGCEAIRWEDEMGRWDGKDGGWEM